MIARMIRAITLMLWWLWKEKCRGLVGVELVGVLIYKWVSPDTTYHQPHTIINDTLDHPGCHQEVLWIIQGTSHIPALAYCIARR